MPPAKVIIGSQNPVKINAVRTGFESVFEGMNMEFVGVNISSGVSDQPFGEEETLQGAKNRVKHAYEAYPDASFWVGIEGGVVVLEDIMYGFAWIVVRGESPTISYPKNFIGKARSAAFMLPLAVQKMVERGIELGSANDQYFGTHASKQGAGAIGLLTENRVTREELYLPAVIMALIPFMKAKK